MQPSAQPPQYVFRQLPGYARFLLSNMLEAFASAMLRYARDADLPLLKHLAAMPEDELVALSLNGTRQLLEAIAEDSIPAYIAESLRNWQEQRLPLIQSDEVLIEDISKVSFIRRKAFRDFLGAYSRDPEVYVGIMEEADRFTQLSAEASYNVLLELKATRLEENEEASRQLIFNAPEAIVVIDQESHILLWNPKAEEIFGWSSDEAIGRTLTETIIPPQYRAAHLAGIQRLESTGESRVLNKTIEIEALRKSGEVFYVALTISRSVRAGEPVYIAFLRDISAEKATALQLAEQQAQLARKARDLERSNNELMAFNYIASHDLKEPVRKISLFSRMIASDSGESLPPRLGNALSRITASAEHMERLIEALVAFSRSTGGERTLEEIDLNAAVAEAAFHLRERIEESAAALNADPLPHITGDAFQLQQLFENLLGNALKYSRPGTAPRISVHADAVTGRVIASLGAIPERRYHRIEITDNGIGFEQEYAEKIFEVFQRLHSKDAYSGTGIGLAICKKIMEQHDGFIVAEGRPGAGAMFSLYFPAIS